MNKTQTLMVLAAIFSVATVMGTQQAMAGSTATTGTVSISAVCELTAPGTLAFNPGNPQSNGAGQGVGETTFVLSNVNGNLDSDVQVSGNNWYDSAGVPVTNDVMSVGNTKYDDTSDIIGNKFDLTTSPAAITTVNAGATQDTFWDLEIELDINANFAGVANQDITFDFTCV